MARSPRLRVRLFIMVLLLAAPAFGLLAFDVLMARQDAAEAARDQAAAHAAGAWTAEAAVIERVEASMRALAASPSATTQNSEICKALLGRWNATFAEFANAALIAPDGHPVCTEQTGVLNVGPHTGRDFFDVPMEKQRFLPGEYHERDGQGRLIFGFPVTHDGETVAVLAASVPLHILRDALSALNPGPETTLFLVDGDGRVLARVPDPGDWSGSIRNETIVTQILEVDGSFDTRLDGEQAIGFSRPTRYEGDLHVAAVTKTESAIAAARAAATERAVVVAIVALATLVALIISWNRLVSRPLQSLQTGADALRGGQLDHRVGHVRLPDELQRVADSFDKMADEVQRSRLRLEAKVMERTIELRRRNEQLSEATRYKSEFLANMSHEIRTPLNAVIGMANVLADMDLGDEQQRAVETIRVSGHHLLAVISDILDISRIEAGRLDLDEHPVAVRDVVEEAVALVAPQARQKGLDIFVEIAEDVPPGMIGDPARLRQILVNLAGNAVKFTDVGHVRVAVDTIDDHVRFSVADTGPGISEDKVDELFTPFHQLSSGSRRAGTGLGLAISRRLASLMNGTVGYTPRPEGGSIFWLQVELRAAAPPGASPWDEPHRLRGRRVLVVDDNPVNLRILERDMKRWGMEVEALQDPEQAFARARTEPFDLMVFDAHLPEVEAGELLRRLRLAGDQTPAAIMGVSGHDSKDAVFLQKPVRNADLFRALAGLLGAKTQSSAKVFDPSLGARHPLRILIVEDSPVNQKVALATLGRFGYTADVASGGFEAIEMAKQGYDLILMDIEMPDLNGRETAKRIVAQGTDAYIAAMTAHVSKEDRQACEEAGMDDYLVKPIAVDALAKVLANAAHHADHRSTGGKTS